MELAKQGGVNDKDNTTGIYSKSSLPSTSASYLLQRNHDEIWVMGLFLKQVKRKLSRFVPRLVLNKGGVSRQVTPAGSPGTMVSYIASM